MHQLWLEKTKRVPREDVESKVPVHLGRETEIWHSELVTKKLSHELQMAAYNNDVGGLNHASSLWTGREDLLWMTAKPDMLFSEPRTGEYDQFDIHQDLVFGGIELKYTGGISRADGDVHLVDMDTMIDRYYAQLQHYMVVFQADWWKLSVIFGAGGRHECRTVMRDPAYVIDLMRLERIFYNHLINDTPPDLEFPKMPIVKVDVAHDFTNSTIDGLGTHLAEYWNGFHAMKEAEKVIKGMIPKTGRVAFGQGWHVTISKSGALKFVPGDYSPEKLAKLEIQSHAETED